MNDIYRGSCLCGQVTFHYTGPSLWCAHCHCSLCRRAHGAPLVTWVGVNAKRFVLDSADSLRWYASSPDSERGFCGCCGSTLFFRSARWPGEMHIARSNFQAEIDKSPEAHAHWESHVNWLSVGDDLPHTSDSNTELN